jgi:hypothetical protein
MFSIFNPLPCLMVTRSDLVNVADQDQPVHLGSALFPILVSTYFEIFQEKEEWFCPD